MCKRKIQLHIYLKKKKLIDLGESGNNQKISKSKLTNNNYDKIITK